MDGISSCSIAKTRSAPVSDSSEDSSDESLESDSEEDADERGKAYSKRKEATPSRGNNRILRCVQDDYLQLLSPDFPRSLLLLRAHQQLDSICSGTRWSAILKALQSLGPQNAQAKVGDEKDYKSNNAHLPTYPQACWNASVERLYGRIDVALSGLKAESAPKEYLRVLPNDERKALKACLQIWRKFIRDRAEKEEAQDPSWHRLLTTIEASVLCHSEYSKRLMICAIGTSIDNTRLRAELENKVQLSNSKGNWSMLDLCGETSAQLRSVLEMILSLSNDFHTIALYKHDTERERGCFSGPRGAKQMSLPAVLMQSRRIEAVRICMEQDDEQDVFTETDFRTVAKRLLQSANDTDGLFNQPHKLATLAAMSSLVVRTHALDTAALPAHLREIVTTANRCTSCQRIMTSGRLLPPSPPSLLSLEFDRQATRAGFKGPKRFVNEVMTSLSNGNPYLPPLTERFKLDAGFARIFEVNIGGSSNARSGSLPDWQFCAGCAALHFNIVKSTSAYCCNCISCKDEREDKSRSFTGVRWRRELPRITSQGQG